MLFDGLHYDPVERSPREGAPAAECTTLFRTTDRTVLAEVEAMAAAARSKRQYTDVSRFSLRCITCDTPLVGQAEAQSHAKATGHTNFGEV